MRARYPDHTDTVTRNGATVTFDVYDNDAPTILLIPTWEIIHARGWKFQIPYLSRHYRVVTYDPIGNGRSSRSTDPDRYTAAERVADAVAVLDATGTKTCIAVGFSLSGSIATNLTALSPDRVDGLVAVASTHPWAVPPPDRRGIADTFGHEIEEPSEWEKYNLHYWKTDWADFTEFFMAEVHSDPHSTKGWDDGVAWAEETTGEVIGAGAVAPASYDVADLESAVRQIDVPSLLIHGDADRVIHHESSLALHKLIPDSRLAIVAGSGHSPASRYPVRLNHLIKDHADRVHGRGRPDATWHVAQPRRKKALMISSPIGLGHARRDLAVVNELRGVHPDLDVEWLAQDPVTRALHGAGETVHAASAHLASESAHIEGESGEHDLAAFQALRAMDEILLSNFMLIDEVVTDGQYDVVIGDESWELDYHLHENPSLKKTSYAWLTDFVGYLPMPEGGDREAFVAADYNAEMIEQVARYGRIRDKAIFVGSPEDIVPDSFGPGLPLIRDWTEENYDFSGYITGFDPAALGDRAALRAQLGYNPDDRVCIVSVGGSGVGSDLLTRVANATPAAQAQVDDLRMILVTGPRIDPMSLPQVPGVEYHEYVDRLYRHLAAADLAIVQGGLTTTMELTATGVPFMYVPLRNHFEQNLHVRARLDRYQAGVFMDYDDTSPDGVATAIATHIGSKTQYRPVETNGAKKAAEMIGELL
ncbi:MAG: alpha/beta fold hydrolase [Acidimicrobiia bacterium]